MNRFLEIFTERGFLHQCTDLEGLGKLGSITAYIGFDCTASSLHVGSLMQIMILRLLKNTGNKPIILLGGATTKIGDPSGKDESRPIITDEVIAKNKAGIKQVFDRFGLSDCVFVDNAEWLEGHGYLDFLQTFGRYFSINRMIAKDSVKQRLEREAEMTFLEFNYMVLQAYDFVQLNKRHSCRVQIGGSDQWGNIVEGLELHRKMTSPELRESTKLFGLTTPLITTSTGAKMGKSAAGALWLDEGMISSYDYYQFWRNTDDADVVKFLKFFTELPLSEIAKLPSSGQEINESKKILAYEATKLCHGEDAAKKAADAATTAFEQGGTAGLPEVKIENKTYKAFELFAAAGLAASNGEARRLIQGGGAKVDDKKVETDIEEIKPADGMKLSSGKKKHIIISLT